MISIITPVLNEKQNIMPFLANIESLDGDFEIIMVDGGSIDGTVEEAQKCKKNFSRKLKVMSSGPGRGIQMNEGTRLAKGNIFLFLHVDCSLKKDAITLIEKSIYETNAVGGGFRQAFSNPDFFLKFQSAIGNLRARLTGIFFGDYGIFMKKEVFRKIGGYDDIPFLEDFEICRKAKRYGWLIQMNRRIESSPRRYFKKGKIKLTVAFNLAILFNFIRWHPEFLWKYIVEM